MTNIFARHNKSHGSANHSLQNIILIITIIFTISIGIIISSASAFAYHNFTRNNMIQSTYANMGFLTDSIDSNINELTRFVRFCQTHEYFTAFMSYDRYSSSSIAINAYKRLNEEYLASPIGSYIHRIIIGNNHNKYLQIVESSYSTSANVSLITKELDFFESQINDDNFNFSRGFISDPYVTRRNHPVLTIIRPISVKYNLISGYAAISLEPEFFLSALAYYSCPSDSSLFLTLGSHTYEMTAKTLTEVDISSVNYSRYKSKSLNTNVIAYEYNDSLDDSSGYYVTRALSVPGCYISQEISKKELYSIIPLFFIIIITITLIIVFIGFALSLILYRIINVPVTKLHSRIDLISQGDFSYDPEIEWNHELGEIGHGINSLSSNISKLMDERIQDEKQKKDLEYQMLQSQINPHFIYNTLNSIRWMAITQGANGIAEMTTALSRLLRSISKGTQICIPLRDELELIKDYFTIQQYRYGRTITMSINIDDECIYDCSIVKFTLQPLIENSIFHGIEPKQMTGHIDIHAYIENDTTVSIVVADDGVGMSKDKVLEILEPKKKDSSNFFKEIGIVNVHKRLQYEFGADYGISIESTPGFGTQMTVRIPFNQERN